MAINYDRFLSTTPLLFTSCGDWDSLIHSTVPIGSQTYAILKYIKPKITTTKKRVKACFSCVPLESLKPFLILGLQSSI